MVRGFSTDWRGVRFCMLPAFRGGGFHGQGTGDPYSKTAIRGLFAQVAGSLFAINTAKCQARKLPHVRKAPPLLFADSFEQLTLRSG